MGSVETKVRYKRISCALALCLLLVAARADGPLVQPADTDYSGSIDRPEVEALEIRWRSGEAGLLDATTQASYLERNGGCYQYNSATSKFEHRNCEPVVASPPVMFYREIPDAQTVVAPVVPFYRQSPEDLRVVAPVVQFAREAPEAKTKAPVVHFAREAPE